MLRASKSVEIAADAGRVWSIVGGFNNLPLWLRIVASSELEDGGRVRRLVTEDGSVIVERLLIFDDFAKHFTYEHVEAPDPVSGYVGEMSVDAITPGRSRATWSSRFTPRGIDAAEAVAMYESVYSRGLGDLKTLIEQG
jgi:hypothetical protein